jgi:hypothetical protein
VDLEDPGYVDMQKVQCVVAKLFCECAVLILLPAVCWTICVSQLPLCCMLHLLSVVALKDEKVTSEEGFIVTDCLMGAQ